MMNSLPPQRLDTIKKEIDAIPKLVGPGKYILTFEIGFATGGVVNSLKVKRYTEYEDR